MRSRQKSLAGRLGAGDTGEVERNGRDCVDRLVGQLFRGYRPFSLQLRLDRQARTENGDADISIEEGPPRAAWEARIVGMTGSARVYDLGELPLCSLGIPCFSMRYISVRLLTSRKLAAFV